MSLHNTSERWGWAAKLLHWVMAILMIGTLGVGIYMTDFMDPVEAYGLIQTHKSFGFVVFCLAVIRVVWRFASPRTPDLPGGMKGWEIAAAKGAHIALYILMFALPLSGWLMASASPVQDLYGIQNMVFGLFPMPDPFVPGESKLANRLETIHEICGKALLVVLLLHVGGALKHHFVNKDTVLRRMLP